ncbi:MAG: hypothetical protein K6U03_01995 [Firmicutes bacterium]|nr:hypothetical protein [Bacillota bacterium]
MSKVLRNESTQAGKEIWRRVDEAAGKAPDWIIKMVEQASTHIEKISSKEGTLSIVEISTYPSKQMAV